MDSLKISEEFMTDQKTLYEAWMSSKGHSEMTDSPAKIEAKIGGEFTAWDGYISGTTKELVPDKKIVQKWRTTEFPDDAPDSDLEISLEPAGKGTTLTLIHTNIPAGQKKQYEDGWTEFYFDPMKEYFKK